MKNFAAFLTKIFFAGFGFLSGIFLFNNVAGATGLDSISMSAEAVSNADAIANFYLLSQGVDASNNTYDWSIKNVDFSLSGYNELCDFIEEYYPDSKKPTYFEFLAEQFIYNPDGTVSTNDKFSFMSNGWTNIFGGSSNSSDNDNDYLIGSAFFASGSSSVNDAVLASYASDLTDDFTTFSSSNSITVPFSFSWHTDDHYCSCNFSSNNNSVVFPFISLDNHYSPYLYFCSSDPISLNFDSSATFVWSTFNSDYNLYETVIQLDYFSSYYSSISPSVPKFNLVDGALSFFSTYDSNTGGFKALTLASDPTAFYDLKTTGATDTDSILTVYPEVLDMFATLDLTDDGALSLPDEDTIAGVIAPAIDDDDPIADDPGTTPDPEPVPPEFDDPDGTVNNQFTEFWKVPSAMFSDIFQPYFDCFGSMSVYNWWILFPIFFLIMIVVKLVINLF